MKKGAYSLFEGSIAPGSTKAPDAKTVVFTLTKPSAIFLATVPEIHVVNAELRPAPTRSRRRSRDRHGCRRTTPAPGSFMLKRYDPAIGWQAERFEDHFYGWDMVEDPARRDRVPHGCRDQQPRPRPDERRFPRHRRLLPQDQVKRLRDSENVYRGRAGIHADLLLDHPPAAAFPMNDLNFRKAAELQPSTMTGSSTTSSRAPSPGIRCRCQTTCGARRRMSKATRSIWRRRRRSTWIKVEGEIPEITLGALAGYGQTEQAAALLQNGLNKIGVQDQDRGRALAGGLGQDARRGADVRPALPLEARPTTPIRTTGSAKCTPASRSGRATTSWYCNEEVDKLLSEARVSTDQELRKCQL